MISFTHNGQNITYNGKPDKTLLDFLRLDHHLTAAKDGCSGQGVCGACTVEINGEAKLACLIKMAKLQDAEVFTIEGFPDYIKETIARAFVNKGAVQCGFCIPGFITRTKVLLQKNPHPSLHEIRQAIKPHLCRCTGYKKIEEAILESGKALRENIQVEITENDGKVGTAHPKYQAYETALGIRKFVDDLFLDGMLFAALKFSDHPKAIVKNIHTQKAAAVPGVHKVFTAADIPGKHNVGLIYDDWPVMIAEGQTTHYIGDVLAGVVADSEEIARQAVSLIEVDYEVLKPVTDVFEAIDGERVHPGKPNHFDTTKFIIGDTDATFDEAKYISRGSYETQRIEHAFLEKESAVAHPDGNGGLVLYSQSQGIYVDRRQIAPVLNIPENKLRVIQVPNGGGFGGKEDLSVQAQTALFAFLLQKPVKLSISRSESIRLHPKRHPVFMDIELAADENGKIIGLKIGRAHV